MPILAVPVKKFIQNLEFLPFITEKCLYGAHLEG